MFFGFLLALFAGVGVLGRALKTEKLAAVARIVIVAVMLFFVLSAYGPDLMGIIVPQKPIPEQAGKPKEEPNDLEEMVKEAVRKEAASKATGQ